MRQKKKQFLVLGLGRFGKSVARSLTELGHEVLAVDNDADAVAAAAEYVTQSVQANCTDEDTIRSFDPAGFDAAVVAIGTNVRDSVLACLLCKEAGAPLVIAKAMDELHGKLLSKIGVDRVIYPERDMGERLARSLTSPSVLDMMELSGDYRVAEVMAPASWADRTLAEIDVRRRYGVSVIGVRRGTDFLSAPGADTRLAQGDVLVAIGPEESINELER